MKKGFTLIELLCIIIILGVIALIAVPMVNTIITESKKESFKTTARSYANVAEKKCLQEQIKQKPITMRYKLENGKINPKLDIKGEVPEGYIYVNDKCEVTYELKNDKYIVYCEKSGDTYYFFIKLGRKRRYLESSELKQLADAAQWFIEHQGSNFGEPIQNLLSKYGH